MEEDRLITTDGTVDYRGNPAKKNETGTWKACPFILGNECCERLAYYGMSSNLVVYFKQKLGQHSATASNNVTNWSGTCYITPLIGAFVADAYLGRYWTIACFSTIYVIGMTLLTLSASIPGLKPTCHVNDSCHASKMQAVTCFIALYLIALGTGGIKPCVSSFGADQFDDTDDVEKKHKGSFFNWFYFSINIGALLAASVLVWVQTNVGWGWGFGIPAVAMAIAIAFFFSGTRLYRNQKPGGSPLARISQVLVASFRKHRARVPEDPSMLYETTDTESAIKGSRKIEHTKDLSSADRNRSHKGLSGSMEALHSDSGGRAESHCKAIAGVGYGYNICHCIWPNGNFVCVTRFNHGSPPGDFKIPAASLGIFDTISVIFWVPIYDRIIVPVARRFTGHKNGITQLQRMGTGLVISIFSMLCAGILELIRLRIVKRNNYYDWTQIPMSIFWQIPQYFIIGCAEVFFFIGQLELFYEQAPDAMRSLCSALQLTTVALGNYLSTLLVTIVTKISTRNGKLGWIPDNLNYGHLHYFFWLLAGLSVLNLGAFLLVAKFYTYKKAIGTLR
ncbi:hypothetical protein F511_37486 [Dorcoceras hygrometricum]|uniref:Protein NRT1/ PTR FAMILY 8.1-like n=1 Tax=Dorcoceras hygrometricum TaxID=472368 RepID=A0A2Z7BGR0_9LAMI|nr:hypothetical protein F511_37486 [Dorcoceras hygrometricum]